MSDDVQFASVTPLAVEPYMPRRTDEEGEDSGLQGCFGGGSLGGGWRLCVAYSLSIMPGNGGKRHKHLVKAMAMIMMMMMMMMMMIMMKVKMMMTTMMITRQREYVS